MDREAGIEAYQAMLTAEEYKIKLSQNKTDHLHKYNVPSNAPVIQVVVSKVDEMTNLVTKYEFKTPDGSDLPKWTAGAHIDIVVAPEFLRQYSMSGNPEDCSRYQIGVLREDEGRGGSKMMHRIFLQGRKIFISKPINHFELDESKPKTFLMGGGIGIAPMIAFAHRLYHLGKDFEVHYSASKMTSAGYLEDLKAVPWSDKVVFHFTDQGKRADFHLILGKYNKGCQLYICGPESYMNSLNKVAEKIGYPEEARHLEYFSVPDEPDYINYDFRLKLSRSKKEFMVPIDKTAADILNDNGYQIDIKCSDGILGVCK